MAGKCRELLAALRARLAASSPKGRKVPAGQAPDRPGTALKERASRQRAFAPAGAPAPLLDARLLILLAALLGVLVWKAGPLGLCSYLAMLAALLALPGPRRRMTPGSIRRSLLFALFWPLLKFLADAAVLAWTARPALMAGWGELLQTPFNLMPEFAAIKALSLGQALFLPGLEAGVLFLRLLAVMGLALALTLSLSPPAMAQAVSRLLRPLLGVRVWSLALALALMLRYVPRIHALAAQTRQAALARGLPSKGLRYWRMGLPHMFRILALDTGSQALGIAARDLARPGAWLGRVPLPAGQIFAAAFMAAMLIMAARI